nr:CotH kinase family protein [Clostridia bacterium]
MLKRYFPVLFFTLLLIALFSVCAFAADGDLQELSVTVDGQTILPASANGGTYFLLPSNADLHAVTLRFGLPEGYALGIGGADVSDGDAIDVAGNAAYDAASGVYILPYTTGSAGGEARTGQLYFMKSETVPAMFVTFADSAYGRAWVDASPGHSNDSGKKTEVRMTMLGADSTVIYNGKLISFKGRGNTTWGSSAKKPYQIKLDKKTDLLASGNSANKNKTWILLANALDKTLFKNAFAFDLSRYLGLTATPEYTFVNLYTDGEYRGLYQLAEKVQINSGRVEIADLEEHNSVTDETAAAAGVNSLGYEYQYNPTAVCDTEDISGGYLLELDSAFYRSENSWFRLSDGNVVVVKSPEFCTREQMEYISAEFNKAYMAAQSDIYGVQSVTELFDLDSLAAIYMVNEYTRNIDYGYSSTWFYLPEEGNATYDHKFYGGPAWDFDTSLGNRTESDYFRTPYGLYQAGRTMFRGSVLRSYAKEKAAAVGSLYGTIFSETPAVNGGLRSLSGYRALIEPAQKMNFTVWPFDDTPNTFALPTYEENYNYVRNFLMTRHGDILPQIAAWETPDLA